MLKKKSIGKIMKIRAILYNLKLTVGIGVWFFFFFLIIALSEHLANTKHRTIPVSQLYDFNLPELGLRLADEFLHKRYLIVEENSD